jgi:hypothetical protein
VERQTDGKANAALTLGLEINMDVAKCAQEAAARIGHRVSARVEYVEALAGNRWKAVLIRPKQGKTSISFDAPRETDAEVIVIRAGLEMQEYLKLCPLCLGAAYVQREDSHALRLYFECVDCARFRFDGEAVTDLRKARVRRTPESDRAVEALSVWTRTAAKNGESPPLIEDWRVDADDYRRRWMK